MLDDDIRSGDDADELFLHEAESVQRLGVQRPAALADLIQRLLIRLFIQRVLILRIDGGDLFLMCLRGIAQRI